MAASTRPVSSRLRKDCHYYICSCGLPALLGDETIPALLDAVVARLLFSHAGYTTREEAERAWDQQTIYPMPGAAPAAPPPTKKKAKVAAAPTPAVAPSAEPLPPPPSEDDLGRKYNVKERKAVPAVLAYRHYEANGGDPPAPFTGKYACFENAAYRELLNKHGQPCNTNPAAKAAFLKRFRYRSWPSISAHPNKFNLDEYKEWRGGDKDKWVGFQWKLLGD